MVALIAPLTLVAARVRRRPGQWLWPVLGVAVAVAFAGAVAAESAVSADEVARTVLRGLSPLDRSVRVTWQGPVTPAAAQRAAGLLRSLGLSEQTTVTLLSPVRLSGTIVVPAAISPLERWLTGAAAARIGPCLPQRCPALLAGGGRAPTILRSAGVRIRLIGSEPLRSDVPLAYDAAGEGRWPLVVTGDPAGLDRLPGLSGVYRTHSWVAELDTAGLHSWQLEGLERRLARAQAALLSGSTQFAMSAPFSGLDAARAGSVVAPKSLLLAGGAAVVAIALFVVLAAAALREDQLADLARLRVAGATATQLAVFLAGEALALSALALAVGFGAAVAVAVVLARAAGEPVGGVLAHSLITPAAGLALLAALVVTSTTILLATQLRDPRGLTAAAVAAVAGLVTALTLGRHDTGVSAVMLAPLCCVAAGVLVFRSMSWLLRPAEWLSRRGPVGTRLAVIGLARAPGLPALAISFLSVAIALGGFALVYRATLVRGAADEAAERVPLDAIISPTAGFATPLQLARLARWRELSRGTVFPVRRTEASYQSGSSVAAVPALAVPARALPMLHGWRASDASASLEELARRLVPPGPVRVPGPMLAPGARELALSTYSPQLAVSITADLRNSDGELRQVALGTAGTSRRVLRGSVPPGRWELEALQLDEGTGLAVTNGHQNGESATPATQDTARLRLGPLLVTGRAERHLEPLPLGQWVAVGASASRPTATASSTANVGFQTSGQPGILRPRQPSDFRSVPVLTDRQTAAAAGPAGALALVVDGQPVRARVVGVLARFPTLGGASAFVVGDEGVLASALNAQLPGQGRPDELWISTRHPAGLRAALGTVPLGRLGRVFRAEVEHAFAHAPIARALTGTQLAAAAVSGLFALLGLLLIVQGPFRDLRLERDLAAQGLGPAALRAELRDKLVLAGVLGLVPGVAVALLLARLSVTAVGAFATGHAPVPPPVTVLPVLQVAVWAAGAAALIVVTGAIAARWLLRDVDRAAAAAGKPQPHADDLLREGWAR